MSPGTTGHGVPATPAPLHHLLGRSVLAGNLLLPSRDQVIEGHSGDAGSDGLDPLVTLLCAGGRDSIRLVLALHHLALAVRLTRLDLLAPAAGVVELQAEWLLGVVHLLHGEVLQRYDSPGLLVCGELKVVETVVRQDEPAPFPRLHAASQFEQPALTVGVEEGMSEVIAVILRDGEGFALDAVEEVLTEHLDLAEPEADRSEAKSIPDLFHYMN